ncbi:MAG: hypothetical protein ACYTBZ_29075 [Planctomycetota bacterium]|jgi:hypothetical protein
MPNLIIDAKRETAKERGFEAYNSGPHLCVEVPDGNYTITCRNSEGKQVTFAFCPNSGPRDVSPGHHCIDIVHHTGAQDEDGVAIQQASFLGRGPTNAVCRYTDEVPTTVVSLSLRKPD